MSRRRRYKNTPIEEALCEFRFTGGAAWDATIPSQLQTQIGKEYTEPDRMQKMVNVGLKTEKGRVQELSFGEGAARVQLATKCHTRMVAVGYNVLSIHILRPYLDPFDPKKSGWDEFRPRISRALDAYCRVASFTNICRIGIRYINKIVIPSKIARVDDFLRCAVPQPTRLPRRLVSYVNRFEDPYDDDVRLVLSQGSVNAPAGHTGILLDLDVIWESEEPVKRDVSLDIAADFRARERLAFESVITDRARELFDSD